MNTQPRKTDNNNNSRYIALLVFISIVSFIIIEMLVLFGAQQTFENFISDAFSAIVLSSVFVGIWGLFRYYRSKDKKG